MASVSSLDKDLRNLRLGKYTPQAADQVRGWIEDVLGEPLAPGDLLDALKDGIALCKYDLVNPSSQHSKYLADFTVQTCKSCYRPTWRPVQIFLYAVRSDGEHFPLPPRLSIGSSLSPISRHLSDSGFV